MDAAGPNESTPWKNGYYQMASCPSMLWLVEGENLIMHSASGKPTNPDNPTYKATWKYGNFGEAHPDVKKQTGKSHYNVEMSLWEGSWNPKAVVSEDGTTLALYGLAHCVDAFTWMSKDEVEKFMKTGDPHDAMPHHYKEQPENQGRLLWLSGAPGLGKSTSGLLLARRQNFVYYEADCFMYHLNPYVSKDVEDPTLAAFTQNFLKGVPQERIDVVTEGVAHWIKATKGENYDLEKVQKYYLAMCADITREKNRIGGNWAIAQAVPTRAMRDCIRGCLGPELLFVVLHMTKEDQLARIKSRHGDDESFVGFLSKSHDIYEPVTEGEPNAVQISVTKDMSKDDVVDEILHSLKDFC